MLSRQEAHWLRGKSRLLTLRNPWARRTDVFVDDEDRDRVCRQQIGSASPASLSSPLFPILLRFDLWRHLTYEIVLVFGTARFIIIVLHAVLLPWNPIVLHPNYGHTRFDPRQVDSQGGWWGMRGGGTRHFPLWVLKNEVVFKYLYISSPF